MTYTATIYGTLPQSPKPILIDRLEAVKLFHLNAMIAENGYELGASHRCLAGNTRIVAIHLEGFRP